MIKPVREVTGFERAVYDAVSRVPAGKVTTYGRVAKEISRGTARAVGTALAKNPFAPVVPCHRVVRSDGSLGGFHGETSGPRLNQKEILLRGEGVEFLANGRIAPDAFH